MMSTDTHTETARALVEEWATETDAIAGADDFSRLISAIAAALATANMPMWTEEKPTDAGHYWYRDRPDDRYPAVVEIYDTYIIKKVYRHTPGHWARVVLPVEKEGT